MNVSSFDIFDTCLVRKCGTPENFFDVFSLRAFEREPQEWERQEFVSARILAQKSVQSLSMTLRDIWNAFSWSHVLLKSKDELYRLELETECEMLVPVLKMQDKVNECRKRGDKIIYISDMYLPSDFLEEILRINGFFKEGDCIYVSCECNAEKWNGELFQYIKEKEHIYFHNWHHYGDNKISDYKVPRKIGIHCTLVNLEYTQYQKQWLKTDFTSSIKVKAIVAGISRAIHHSLSYNTHLSFFTDIVSPLYASLVYRIMNDAVNKGITKLFFCARDAYMIYQIAIKYKQLFPDIEVKYLLISQKSLYNGNREACLQYLLQEGVATKSNDVAIVDIRSSGKTISILNKILEENGYNRIKEYLFELIRSMNYPYNGDEIYSEWQDSYAKLNPCCERIGSYWQLYEMFFSVHNQQRTIDYALDKDGKAYPVFDSDNQSDIEEQKVGNAYVVDSVKWEQIHKNVILAFIDTYIATQMYKYSDIVYNEIAMPTFIRFMGYPSREYAIALTDMRVYSSFHGKYIPYVKEENWFHLLRTRGNDTYWKRATKMLKLPQWIMDLYLSNVNK